MRDWLKWACSPRKWFSPPPPPEKEEQPALPKEVREASHALANEVTQFTAVTRQLKRSPDPLEALVRGLRRKQR